MKMVNLHNWDLSPTEAVALQKELAGRVCMCRFTKNPKKIAGVDCAFTADKKNIISAIVVLRTDDFTVIETVYAVRPVTFPYIPGLLSFRESPACLAAAEKLRTRPDCVMVDGQGIAHPRRLGLAAHLGLFLDIPTIGCAKSRLIGEHGWLAAEKGAHVPLRHHDSIIGAVVRTRARVKPVFVSVGNKCTLDDAIRVVLSCALRYRLPEPVRIAHQTVTQLKSKVNPNSAV